FNRGRGEDELIAFNHWFGESTRTNRWGSEVTLSLLGPPRVNDTTFAIVVRVDSAGNRPIPPQGMVLSGHDAAGDWLRQQCTVGDTVRLWVGLESVRGAVSWVIGGGPRLVRDGEIAAAEIASWGNGGFVTARHPRTAIGFSADSSLVFLVTVDGRQPGYSEGMTLLELATFLVDLGAQQALNLDGGGSTTMVINGKVVNRPAEDGQERPIVNAIVVRRRASEGQ
ncbi:MAG: phosphodiester glycosidase family protein, partial [Calditrichaeota bacterium]|nr:phosphodiester glycosidase family protein [Calditrichota bacterium]